MPINHGTEKKHMHLPFITGCLADTKEATDFNSGNTTHVSATIGRTATFKCTAKNLVGQKTVKPHNRKSFQVFSQQFAKLF